MHYRSSVFAAKGFVCGGHLTLVLSLLTLIPICVQLSGLLNCSRELLVISSLTGTWVRIWATKARGSLCWGRSAEGAGVVLVTARSRVVWRWEKHSTLYWIRKTSFFIYEQMNLCVLWVMRYNLESFHSKYFLKSMMCSESCMYECCLVGGLLLQERLKGRGSSPMKQFINHPSPVLKDSWNYQRQEGPR